jgi:hypothetical protein
MTSSTGQALYKTERKSERVVIVRFFPRYIRSVSRSNVERNESATRWAPSPLSSDQARDAPRWVRREAPETGYQLELGKRGELAEGRAGAFPPLVVSDLRPTVTDTPRGTIAVLFPTATLQEVLSAYLEVTSDFPSLAQVRQTARDLGPGRAELSWFFERGLFVGQSIQMSVSERAGPEGSGTEVVWNADGLMAQPLGLFARTVLLGVKWLGSIVGRVPVLGAPVALLGLIARTVETLRVHARSVLLADLAIEAPLAVASLIDRARRRDPTERERGSPPIRAELSNPGLRTDGLNASETYYLGAGDPKAFIDLIAREPARIVPAFMPTITLGKTVIATAQGGTFRVVDVSHEPGANGRPGSRVTLELGGIVSGQVLITAERATDGDLLVTDSFIDVRALGGLSMARLLRVNHQTWIGACFQAIAETVERQQV